jgi:hypothetical protein
MGMCGCEKKKKRGRQDEWGEIKNNNCMIDI